MTSGDHRDESIHERLVRIECGHCGRAVDYGGTGRRPRYCSPTCRSRAWELRQAASRLDQPNPMPAVVCDVVERTVERTVARTPTYADEWVRHLGKLETIAREHPESLVRHPDQDDDGGAYFELRRAVMSLAQAFDLELRRANYQEDAGGPPPPPEPLHNRASRS